jgi:hypothetical protein
MMVRINTIMLVIIATYWCVLNVGLLDGLLGVAGMMKLIVSQWIIPLGFATNKNHPFLGEPHDYGNPKRKQKICAFASGSSHGPSCLMRQGEVGG